MRLYTVDEARALLPRVVLLLQQLSQAITRLQAFETHVFQERQLTRSNGHSEHDGFEVQPARPPAEALQEQIQSFAARIAELGIEIKDPIRGLIDFYSDRDGVTVSLCFLLGENDIGYWHPLDGGFAGRKPL
jgi:hypothetical protein